jgi:hypothetical protein
LADSGLRRRRPASAATRELESKFELHIPLLDREHQTKGFFTRADFTFDPQANVFICPAGKQLRSTGLVREDGTMPYWATTKDCRACALKSRCTKGAKRIVTRNLFEADASMCAR